MLFAWVALVALVARVYWQGLLFVVAAHGLLVVGVWLGTAIVARRRDPAEPLPEPEPPPEPGAPRRRVPSLEASAAAVLLPSLAALLGVAGGLVYILPVVELPPAPRAAAIAVAWVGPALAQLVGRYVGRGPAPLHEAGGLAAWARGLAWTVGVAGVGLGLGGTDQAVVADLGTWVPALSGLSLVEALSLGLFAWVGVLALEPLARAAPGLWSWWNLREAPRPTRLPAAHAAVVHTFFSQAHPIRSVFATLDATMGIDLRSSWALAFVRRATEPLALAVLGVGWLTTSLVMVDVEEQAVTERFGRPQVAGVLGPGLHVVLPWPVERVRRVDTARVRTLTVGHEEEAPPAEVLAALDPSDADDAEAEAVRADVLAGDDGESRLWAKQHADEEYTLLLGDGRDLVTVDAMLHYRVRDPIAWLYGMQNPEAALRSLAYQAVMEKVIGQTLDDALGQDFAELARHLEGRIQAEADAHALGVEVVDFTLGALHPPVSVAQDYQAVVSAQITRDTDRIGAEAYRIQRLSSARTDHLEGVSEASAVAAGRRAEAVGEAAAFLGLRATVRTAEADYRFRRRMEATVAHLSGRSVVVIDHRLERDGMGLWLTPDPR